MTFDFRSNDGKDKVVHSYGNGNNVSYHILMNEMQEIKEQVKEMISIIKEIKKSMNKE